MKLSVSLVLWCRMNNTFSNQKISPQKYKTQWAIEAIYNSTASFRSNPKHS